jgi:hypothetical protein
MNKKDMVIKVLMETSRLIQMHGWNKYSMARDSVGNRCAPESSDAACYCLSGALVKTWRAIDPSREEFYFKFFEKQFSEVLTEKYNYPYTYTRWNDEVALRKEDILELIHSVIVSLVGKDTGLDLDPDSFAQANMVREAGAVQARAARGQYVPA